MDRFEYKTICLRTESYVLNNNFDPVYYESEFNALGKHGWELVTYAPIAQADGLTRFILVTFKRKIEHI